MKNALIYKMININRIARRIPQINLISIQL